MTSNPTNSPSNHPILNIQAKGHGNYMYIQEGIIILIIGTFGAVICCCLFCIAQRFRHLKLVSSRDHLQVNHIDQYGSNEQLPYTSWLSIPQPSITPITHNEICSDEKK